MKFQGKGRHALLGYLTLELCHLLLNYGYHGQATMKTKEKNPKLVCFGRSYQYISIGLTVRPPGIDSGQAVEEVQSPVSQINERGVIFNHLNRL